MKKRNKGYIKIGDPNAKAMWGRTRHEVFRDRTKYSRKDHLWDDDRWN